MKPLLQFSVPCLEVLEKGSDWEQFLKGMGVETHLQSKGDGRPPTFAYLFYELPFPSFPVVCPRFYINNAWCSGKGTFAQEIKILLPDKQTVLVETGKQEFTLEEPYTPQLLINIFDGVEFKEQGHYWIQVLLDGSAVLQYPLTIRLAQKLGVQGPAEGYIAK